MSKIFFIGDTHFGKNYPYKKNHELYISERNFDAINNCEKIVQHAIQEEAELVVFLGDLYDRTSISGTIRKYVREKIFFPLFQKGIRIIIIGGNHDTARHPKRGVDLQELSSFPNVEVFTGLKSEIIEMNGLKIGCLFLPFIHYDVLVEMGKDKGILSEADLENDRYIVAQSLFERFIKLTCEGKLKDCDRRILIGHYYLDGSKIREVKNPEAIYGEFKFTRQMVQKDYFDLVIFGHVHLKQTVWDDDRIVVPGSIDRIDMGERESHKFYCSYDVKNDDLQFHEIECRNLYNISIQVPEEMENYTKFVMDNLPKRDEIKGAVCKVFIHYLKGKGMYFDAVKIENHFKDSFYTDIKYLEVDMTKPQKLRELTLDPLTLFEDYMKKNYSSREDYEILKKMGIELIERESTEMELTTKGPLSIKSIDIQNFNNYGRGPNKIEFDNDLYVIKGPTGAGKSSLLDAITFALFKTSTRKEAGLNLDEILYENGYVYLDVVLGDKLLSIKRRSTSPKLEIQLDGAPLYGGLSIPKKEEKIESIIGYDYKAFKSSFFIRQQELQIFSNLSSSDRQDTFSKLFKLRIFQDIYKKLKPKIEELNKIAQNLDGEIKGQSILIENLPIKEHDLKEKNLELKERTKEKENLDKKIQELKEKEESLQGAATKYQDVHLLLEENQKNIKDNEKDIIKYKEDQEFYNSIKEELEKLPDLRKEREDLSLKLKEINEMKNQSLLLQKEINSNEELIKKTKSHFDRQINNLIDKKEEKERRLSIIDSSLSKEEAFDLLKKNGMYTERMDRIKNIEIPMAREYQDQRRIDEFNRLVITTKKNLEINSSKQDKITKEVFISDEIINEKNSLLEEIEGIQKDKEIDVSKYENEILRLKNEIKQKGLDIDFNTQIEHLDEKLKKINENQERREKLYESLREQKDFSSLIEKSEKDLENFKSKKKELIKELKELEFKHNDFRKFFEEREKRQEDLNELKTNINGIEIKIEGIKKEITQINSIKENIKSLNGQLNDIKKDIEKNVLLREEIFHLNKIQKYAIGKILPSISVKASEILSDLTDGKFNQITFKPIEIKGRVGFNIIVFDGEREREASTFSGGEKTQINAAIRFAIMEKIAQIPDTSGAIFRKSDTLFIDEGDLGTLDDESARQRFVEKIFELKSIFKEIILITHLEDVAEQFPNRITIGRDELGKSKIFKVN